MEFLGETMDKFLEEFPDEFLEKDPWHYLSKPQRNHKRMFKELLDHTKCGVIPRSSFLRVL